VVDKLRQQSPQCSAVTHCLQAAPIPLICLSQHLCIPAAGKHVVSQHSNSHPPPASRRSRGRSTTAALPTPAAARGPAPSTWPRLSRHSSSRAGSHAGTPSRAQGWCCCISTPRDLGLEPVLHYFGKACEAAVG
jgi:hypothetical protein